MTRHDPHVARSLLRHELQLLCAGVSHSELGQRLGVSRAAFSQMLAGRNLPSLPALEVLADGFGQRDRLPFLRGLLHDARAHRGRWADPTGRGLAEGLRLTATRITAFDRCTVNPALRTPAYSAALGYEPTTLGHAAVTWYAEEQLLLRLVGHADTMRNQVDRLIALVETATLALRVVPATARPVPGLIVGFSLFDREDGRAVVMEETNRRALFADAPGVVREYRGYIDQLDARAWDSDQSANFLRAGRGTGGHRGWP